MSTSKGNELLRKENIYPKLGKGGSSHLLVRVKICKEGEMISKRERIVNRALSTSQGVRKVTRNKAMEVLKKESKFEIIALKGNLTLVLAVRVNLSEIVLFVWL